MAPSRTEVGQRRVFRVDRNDLVWYDPVYDSAPSHPVVLPRQLGQMNFSGESLPLPIQVQYGVSVRLFPETLNLDWIAFRERTEHFH